MATRAAAKKAPVKQEEKEVKKRPPRPKAEVTIEGLTLNISVTNPDGSNGGTIALLLENLTKEVKQRAALSGIGYRISRAADPMKAATDIAAGNWPEPLVGKGVVPIAALALSRVQGESVERATEVWKGLTPEEQKALRKDFRIKAMIETIKAERSSREAADLGSLFGSGEEIDEAASA